jgi:hypothetical protein
MRNQSHHPIYGEVLSFINAPEPTKFEALALEVFRFQLENVRAYREYCRRIGARENQISCLEDIPPISTLAFKYARLAGAEATAGEKTFLTSGTTVGRNERGTHLVKRPEIYRASALAHLRRMMFPDAMRMRILAMHPTAERMPESSLSQMISWCIEEFGREPCVCVADRAGIDTAAACDFLKAAQRDNAPVCILGTTASLGALFIFMEAEQVRLSLPKASRIMDTGGAKGQAIPLDAGEVCASAAKFLGVEEASVINEYGMTELCSQLYDATAFNSGDDAPPTRRTKLAPPWMRAAAVNPVTLKSVAPGEIGMLRFFDLANVGSVSAILTEDFGTVSAEGDRIRVMGRAGVAEPRGCALAIEEFEDAEIGRIR